MRPDMAGLVALAAAALALGCDSPATPSSDPAGAQLAMVSNDRQVLDEIATSDCPGGEDIRVQGVVHSTVSVTNSARGGFDIHLHTNWAGVKGTSLVTGIRYIAQESSNLDAHFPGPTEGNATSIPGHLALIGQGGAVNEVVHFVIHQTTDANGTTRVDFDKFFRQCS